MSSDGLATVGGKERKEGMSRKENVTPVTAECLWGEVGNSSVRTAG